MWCEMVCETVCGTVCGMTTAVISPGKCGPGGACHGR